MYAYLKEIQKTFHSQDDHLQDKYLNDHRGILYIGLDDTKRSFLAKRKGKKKEEEEEEEWNGIPREKV